MITLKKLNVSINTPLFWVIIYFTQIIIFAFIYLSVSDQFYHSTAPNEPSLQRDKRELELNLERVIYAKIINSEEFEVPQVYVSIDFVSRNHISLLIANNLGGSVAKGKLHLFQKSHTSEEVYMQFDFLNFGSGLSAEYDDEGNAINEYGTKVPTIVGEWGHFQILPDQDLLELYRGWRAAHEGQPSRKNGLFNRLLYLSVVTTTTLGYGDIVPLTPLTRLLVALQTILGVVITAVFLNALLNRRS